MFKNNLLIYVFYKDFEFVRYFLSKFGYQFEYLDMEQSSGGFVTLKSGAVFNTYNVKTTFNNKEGEIIDCGNNIELFLSLAAMRDDTDKYQQFVSEADCSWVNIGIWHNKGDFSLSLTDNFNDVESKFLSSAIPCHKASVEEIMNYFLKNPEYMPYRNWYRRTSIESCIKSMNDFMLNSIRIDEYLILANEEIYEKLKESSLNQFTNDEKTFFVNLLDKPVRVVKDNTTSFANFKMVLVRNGIPYIYVDENGDIFRIEDNKTKK